MSILPLTHTRLEKVVQRWRKAQSHETHGDRLTPAGEAYRQCANDLELALRDDELERPRR